MVLLTEKLAVMLTTRILRNEDAEGVQVVLGLSNMLAEVAFKVGTTDRPQADPSTRASVLELANGGQGVNVVSTARNVETNDACKLVDAEA